MVAQIWPLGEIIGMFDDMGRGSRCNSDASVALAAGDELRVALRDRSRSTRSDWVRQAQLAAAPESIAAGDYTIVADLCAKLAENDTDWSAGTERSMHIMAAVRLAERAAVDVTAFEPALRYANALHDAPFATTLCEALAGSCVEEVAQRPAAPRRLVPELLWRSGASTPKSVYDEADSAEERAVSALAERLNDPTVTPPTRETVLGVAQETLAHLTAVRLRHRLSRAPVMYGVWIRRSPKTKLPEESWLHQAIVAASSAESAQAGVEVFREQLAELAR